MRNRLFSFGFFAILVALLFIPAVADACRCVPREAAALARAADAIIVAEVTRIDDRDPVARVYRLRVSSSWKTRLAGAMIVRTEATTCRADLMIGRHYLVYLKRSGGGYWTDGCAGNLPVARAKPAMAVLGRPIAGR